MYLFCLRHRVGRWCWGRAAWRAAAAASSSTTATTASAPASSGDQGNANRNENFKKVDHKLREHTYWMPLAAAGSSFLNLGPTFKKKNKLTKLIWMGVLFTGSLFWHKIIGLVLAGQSAVDGGRLKKNKF